MFYSTLFCFFHFLKNPKHFIFSLIPCWRLLTFSPILFFFPYQSIMENLCTCLWIFPSRIYIFFRPHSVIKFSIGREEERKMPLYDCMLLLKPHVKKEALLELAARVGKHVYSRNGVLTEIKSLGTVQLGYGIKKLDGRYFQGQLMQMTMMATPNINKELHYLNKEDRLLRWLLVKHRDTKYGLEFFGEDFGRNESRRFAEDTIFVEQVDDEEDDGDEDEDDDDDEEDVVDQEEKKEE